MRRLGLLFSESSTMNHYTVDFVLLFFLKILIKNYILVKSVNLACCKSDSHRIRTPCCQFYLSAFISP